MAHLTRYTQVLSKPGETFTYTVRTLCQGCSNGFSGLSKMHGVYGDAECEACGAKADQPPALLDAIARDFDNLETWE